VSQIHTWSDYRRYSCPRLHSKRLPNYKRALGIHTKTHPIPQSTGPFVIFPGTEWCGNSAAGGNHNVVFLADSTTHPLKFPFDRMEMWPGLLNGPRMTPKTSFLDWPLDKVNVTYARAADSHLLIPHLLERLVGIGSAWAQSEWLLQDAVRWRWKLVACAHSDKPLEFDSYFLGDRGFSSFCFRSDMAMPALV
jgi:hypothetical protein